MSGTANVCVLSQNKYLFAVQRLQRDKKLFSRSEVDVELCFYQQVCT